MKFYSKIIIAIALAFCVQTSALANPVQQLFEQGVAAYESRQYARAIELFEASIKIYPNLAPAYNYLGLCYKSLNANAQVVIKFFEKAIETDPNYLLAYDNLAKIYYGLNDYAKAEEYNLKTIELNPKMMTSYLSLGWINLLGKSDAEEAIYYFEKVVEENQMPYAYFGLGLANFLDSNNVEVLNIITILRNSGQEPLALHLERMVRENRYIAPNQPRTEVSQSPQEEMPAELPASLKEKPTPPKASRMKVRLRKVK